MQPSTMQLGDFTGLAETYSRNRPGYSRSAASALIGMLNGPPATLDAVDVGAGTGIWTRQLASYGFRTTTAVEPNDEMRATGERDSAGHRITWVSGQGAATGLAGGSTDLLTMASSFHWVDFDDGIDEFVRVLRPAGRLGVVYNPRLVEANPLLHDIESYLHELNPDLRRKTSGRSSDVVGDLSDRLAAHPDLDDVVYVEAREVAEQTVEHYLDLWRSVNDVRAQLGEDLFARFLDHASDMLAGRTTVEQTYLTRLWSARRCGS